VGQERRELCPLRDPTFAHDVTPHGMTDNEKPNFSDKTVRYSHFIYHKSHMNCPGMGRRPPSKDAGD
jgi:hypothetical protein